MSHRVIAALVLGMVGWTGSVAEAAADRPPNVVVFLIDDLGWTDLSRAGSDLYETPNVDRLAREGMTFTDAYAACTVCSPTRAAVLTGKYPARLRLTDWIHGHKRPFAKLAIPEWTESLPHDETTMAEALKPLGYASVSIGKWHLGDEPGQWPTHHGFDHNVAGYGRGQPPSYFSPYNIPTLEDGPEGEDLTDRLAEEAVRFIEEHKDRPFLLYMPHYAVHTPLQAKGKLVEAYREKLTPDLRHTNPIYAAMVRTMDEAIGRVVGVIDELGLAEETLIVFTSDNGGLTLRDITSNAPLRAGKGSAYEGGVRVPLIVRWPGTVPAETSCDEPVISNDLFATALDVAGADGEADLPDARSLLPLLRDPGATLGRDALFWHYPHYHPGGATPYSAIRAGGWKLIEFFEDDRVELYHLAEDIGESTDLAATMPEKAAELRDRLDAWRVEVEAQLPRPNPDYDPDRAARTR
ncbi:sulfatase [Tautonia sp. JC769]|uniref:sulfatase n=1 Tax=Tautonia sp. JC769 TaxID=3232135 RepID=UPI00345947C6